MKCGICQSDTYTWQGREQRIFDRADLDKHRVRVHYDAVQAARSKAEQTRHEKRMRERAEQQAANELAPRPECVEEDFRDAPVFTPIVKAYQWRDDTRRVCRLTGAQKTILDTIDGQIEGLRERRRELAAEWLKAGGAIVTCAEIEAAQADLKARIQARADEIMSQPSEAQQ